MKIDLIKEKLACPVCKNKLVIEESIIVCASCGRKYPQDTRGCINLLPVDILRGKNSDIWHKRQKVYRDWFTNIWNERLALITKSLYDEYSEYVGEVMGLTLDIGCGSGHFKSYLKRADYIGIEPLEKFTDLNYNIQFMDKLFPHCKEECVFINSVGEFLPFENGSFGHIFINNVLDHVSSPRKVLDEACRVLKPNGRLFMICESQAMLRKILGRPLKDIFYSIVNRISTLLVCRSLTAPHLKINNKELIQWLKEGFAVNSMLSAKKTHIFIRAIKQHNA